MIELNIVQEQYARMGDQELIEFAKNESLHLTIESFHLLNLQFERRNIDKSILEQAELDKELSNLNNQTTFEKITAYEFTKSLWDYSLNEKQRAVSNRDIYDGLVKKGVNEQYAFMLLESLESKSKEMLDNFETEIILGWLILAAGIILIFFSFGDELNGLYAVYGTLLSLAGFLRLYKSYSKKKKYQHILNNILAEKNFEKEEQRKKYN
ncbi:MAG TPA: hypothetical protein VIJ75_01925 [Hanamia sp.]